MHLLDILIGSVSGVVVAGIVVAVYHGVLLVRETTKSMVVMFHIKKIASHMKEMADQEVMRSAQKRLKDIYANTSSDDGYDFDIDDDIGE